MWEEFARGHIERFLGKHPGAHLYVAVGYASVWGLAWMQRYTSGRRVTLLIGETRSQHFAKATNAERSKAITFLQRKDVRVLNWYRTAKAAQGQSMLHAKAWIIADEKSHGARAALVGSANLTKSGLEKKWEIMAVAADHELSRIWTQLNRFLKGGNGNKPPWDAKERLIDQVRTGGETKPKPAPKTSTPATKPATAKAPSARQPSKPAKKKGGCLTLVAATGGMVVAAVAMILLLL